MQVYDYKPTALLSPFIRAYKIIESHDERINRVLPNPSLTIAFRFKGQTNYVQGLNLDRLPVSTISGLRQSVRLINYTENASTLLVLFRETGAASFFKEPLHELFEESVSLDHFIKKQALSVLEEELAEAPDHPRRIPVIEQFLLSKLYNPKPDPLIQTAVRSIYSTTGNVRIKDLASALFISADAFEKRFRKTVGTSPKQFSTIVRLQSVVRQGIQNQPLAHLALDAGYFDQPHFNKDFKRFTGLTPTDFFKSPSFW